MLQKPADDGSVIYVSGIRVSPQFILRPTQMSEANPSRSYWDISVWTKELGWIVFLKSPWSKNCCLSVFFTKASPQISPILQYQQWQKKTFCRYFNIILEFVTSWKIIKNVDDSSCTGGGVCSFLFYSFIICRCHGCIKSTKTHHEETQQAGTGEAWRAISERRASATNTLISYSNQFCWWYVHTLTRGRSWLQDFNM